MSRSTTRGALLPLVLLPLASACYSAFRVSSAPARSDEQKPKGVPFHRKTEVHRQHSTYEYPWVRVTLSMAPLLPTKPTDTAEKLGARTTYVIDVRDDAADWTKIRALQDAVRKLSGATRPADAEAALVNVFTAREALPALAPGHAHKPDASLLRLVGNYVERVSVVDYSRTYYLNASIPPFGSNSLEAQLAPDGTLSKSVGTGTGGVGDAVANVAAALTGFLPIKEALTANWAPSKADSTAMKNQKATFGPMLHAVADPATFAFRVEVAVESQALKFDFTTDRVPAATTSNPSRLTPNYEQAFTVTPVERPMPAAPAAANAISFTGKVQLPEAKKP